MGTPLVLLSSGVAGRRPRLLGSPGRLPGWLGHMPVTEASGSLCSCPAPGLACAQSPGPPEPTLSQISEGLPAGGPDALGASAEPSGQGQGQGQGRGGWRPSGQPQSPLCTRRVRCPFTPRTRCGRRCPDLLRPHGRRREPGFSGCDRTGSRAVTSGLHLSPPPRPWVESGDRQGLPGLDPAQAQLASAAALLGAGLGVGGPCRLRAPGVTLA